MPTLVRHRTSPASHRVLGGAARAASSELLPLTLDAAVDNVLAASCWSPTVKGGPVRGARPTLAGLDRWERMGFHVDFRSYYASILDGWLGGGSTEVLGGTFENLGLFARAPGTSPDGSTTLPPADRHAAVLLRARSARFGWSTTRRHGRRAQPAARARRVDAGADRRCRRDPCRRGRGRRQRDRGRRVATELRHGLPRRRRRARSRRT